MYKHYIVSLMISLCLFSTFSLHAEESKEQQPKLAYFTLEPDLTTNFHTTGKKLGYIQVRIDIMVADQADLAAIEHHQPLVRDTVVEMLGQQSKDTIESLAGREEIRKKLVTKLNEILLPETGKAIVADLLFTKYIYQ